MSTQANPQSDQERAMEELAQLAQENSDKKLVTITEAARINNVTRQAIYVAIKLKKLRARKESSRWRIHLDDLADYRRQKYSRAKSMYEGQLLFDNRAGYYSVNQVAKMLGVPAQKIYYATRVGLLKAERRGAAWVIHEDAISEYRSGYLDRRQKKQLVG